MSSEQFVWLKRLGDSAQQVKQGLGINPQMRKTVLFNDPTCRMRERLSPLATKDRNWSHRSTEGCPETTRDEPFDVLGSKMYPTESVMDIGGKAEKKWTSKSWFTLLDEFSSPSSHAMRCWVRRAQVETKNSINFENSRKASSLTYDAVHRNSIFWHFSWIHSSHNLDTNTTPILALLNLQQYAYPLLSYPLYPFLHPTICPVYLKDKGIGASIFL